MKIHSYAYGAELTLHTQLVDLALAELIRMEKNREWAKLAGKFPDLSDVPRRKPV